MTEYQAPGIEVMGSVTDVTLQLDDGSDKQPV